jgi:hypothetical protein
MDSEEIRKWKRSALKALNGPFTGAEATVSATAALWEIAAQLSILNNREDKLYVERRRIRAEKNSGKSKRR